MWTFTRGYCALKVHIIKNVTTNLIFLATWPSLVGSWWGSRNFSTNPSSIIDMPDSNYWLSNHHFGWVNLCIILDVRLILPIYCFPVFCTTWNILQLFRIILHLLPIIQGKTKRHDLCMTSSGPWILMKCPFSIYYIPISCCYMIHILGISSHTCFFFNK